MGHQNRSSKAKIARAYIAAQAGVERVRITKGGEVHAYGPMQNTNQVGWYLAGDIDTLASMAHADAEMARDRAGR